LAVVSRSGLVATKLGFSDSRDRFLELCSLHFLNVLRKNFGLDLNACEWKGISLEDEEKAATEEKCRGRNIARKVIILLRNILLLFTLGISSIF